MAYEPIWMQRGPEKLHKMEFLKIQKDGLDVIRTIIEEYSVKGFSSITEDDMSRFKWAGVYQQKPNNGHFMMRIRINGGVMTSDQARELGQMAIDYGRDLVDVTTRQAIQYHWLEIEQFPDIFKRLEKVGLYSYEACGDCPRAITGNPLAGIDPDELFDDNKLVNEINDFFMLNRDYSNLPRKYKISISANMHNAANAEINCLAFTPATKEINGETVNGYHVWVGGGLSAKPYLAQQLDIFCTTENALKVAEAVTIIYRDNGYREKRHHARLKFLVADWGVEKFKEELIKITGELPSRGTDMLKGWSASYYNGVRPQKQPGLSYVGLNVPVGRLTGTELIELARIADQYGSGSIRTTVAQDLIITDIPNEKIEALLQEPLLQRLNPNPNRFMSRTVSCTGNEFCNLAIVETKKRAENVALYLDNALPDFKEEVRIHFVGCPNNCGQKYIADIGLQGALLKTPEGMIEAFDIAVGGTLGEGAQFNKVLKGKVSGENAGPVVEQLIRYYADSRSNAEETFNAFYKRVGHDAVQEKFTEILAAI